MATPNPLTVEREIPKPQEVVYSIRYKAVERVWTLSDRHGPLYSRETLQEIVDLLPRKYGYLRKKGDEENEQNDQRVPGVPFH